MLMNGVLKVMPDVPSSPTKPPELLTLSELVLLRTWIRGVPLSSLDNQIDPSTFTLLKALRLRLYLKATRLKQPTAGLWLKRHAGPAWEKSALDNLEVLLHHPDIMPAPGQPLSFWLAPELLAPLSAAGFYSLQDLSDARHRSGNAWWQGIPGLGRTGAKQAARTLDSLGLAIPSPVKPPALPTYSTGLVPLERFLLPECLDGSTGSNRSGDKPFIDMPHDLAAIQAWLALFDPASHTHRSYQREVERLLLWAILVRHKAFADLNASDLAEYRGFLKDPQPSETWIGPPQSKTHSQWKPFTGPLALQSIKHTETILKGLFNFLVQQRYLAHNPLSALPRLKTPSDHIVLGVHRAFSPSQWTLITQAAEHSVQHSTCARPRKALRTQFILHLAYATGLRLHELAQTTVGDLFSIARTSSKREGRAGSEPLAATTQHWLKVLGKGQKLRQVPLPPTTLAQLNISYQALTGQLLAKQHPDYPLIPSLHDSGLAVTPLAVHKILKAFFTQLSQQIFAENPESASHILKASAHWLRHTHGSIAVDQGIPLTMIRDNLGHASIATTSHYLHTETDARYEAFKQLAETAEHKPG